MANDILKNVQTVNQESFTQILKSAIEVDHNNILVFASSGAGKTEISRAVIKDCNCRYLYISLPVLERVDFQGMPVVNKEILQVNYATPSYLPFKDSEKVQELDRIKAALPFTEASESHLPEDERVNTRNIKQQISDLEGHINALKFLEASSWLSFDGLAELLEKANKYDDKSSWVILFDEVDKAPHEVCQVLLELLQEKTVNGRPINVRCCILTANLPDENAYSNNISHAITKRCGTYKMNVEWEPWRKWASENGFDGELLAYLISEQATHNFVLYRAAEAQTEYALPSPRTWVFASETKKKIEEAYPASPDRDKLVYTRIAGYVGETLAIKFKAFKEVYQKYEPTIKAILEKGEALDASGAKIKIENQHLLVIGIRVFQSLENLIRANKETPSKFENQIKNAFKWLESDVKNTEDQYAIFKLGMPQHRTLSRDAKLFKYPEILKFADLVLNKQTQITDGIFATLDVAYDEKNSSFFFVQKSRTGEVTEAELQEINAKISSSHRFETLVKKGLFWKVKTSSTHDKAILELQELGVNFDQRNSKELVAKLAV